MKNLRIILLAALILSIPILAQEESGLNFHTDATNCNKIVGLSISKTVEYIDLSKIDAYYSLDSIDVSKKNPNYSSEDGVLYDKKKTTLLYCPRGRAGKLVIPQSVRKVEENALKSRYKLTSISIPDSIKNVTELIKEILFRQVESYSGCLFQVPLDVDDKNVPPNCFWEYNLSEIIVSPGNPFYASQDGLLYDKNKFTLICCPPLKQGEVILPKSVRKIDERAFADCRKLTKVVPGDLVRMDKAYFFLCEELAAIEVSATNPYYTTVDGVLYNKGKSTLLFCPRAKPGEIMLPGSVKNIADKAFYYCRNLTKIVLNNSVRVDKSCFCYCAELADIEASEANLNYASQDGILYNKDKTKIICFPAGLQGDVYLPGSLKVINKLFDSNIPYGKNCTLHIPRTTIEIQNEAFIRCAARIKLDNNNLIKRIGFRSFSFCENLDSMSLPSVDTICPYAFQYCLGIKSITILSESLKKIDFLAFQGCRSLTSLTIPKSVVQIEMGAFSDCKNLKEITVAWAVPVKYEEGFETEVYSKCVLKVPQNRADAYKKAPVWRGFRQIEEY